MSIKTFDVIIVSYGKNNKFIKMTQRAVDTAIGNAGCEIGVYVVEQARHVEYKRCQTIHYDFAFNYNKCLNYGISFTDAEKIVVCNNDLHFHEDWAINLNAAFLMGYDSACPYCPLHHKGKFQQGRYLYPGDIMGKELVGWCIGLTRELYDKIGGFDESVEFWYSDNLYGIQMQSVGAKHTLVGSAFVEHLYSGSRTLRTSERIKQLTEGQLARYKEAKESYAKREISNTGDK